MYEYVCMYSIHDALEKKFDEEIYYWFNKTKVVVRFSFMFRTWTRQMSNENRDFAGF